MILPLAAAVNFGTAFNAAARFVSDFAAVSTFVEHNSRSRGTVRIGVLLVPSPGGGKVEVMCNPMPCCGSISLAVRCGATMSKTLMKSGSLSSGSGSGAIGPGNEGISVDVDDDVGEGAGMSCEMQMHDSPRRPLREVRDGVGYVRTVLDLTDSLLEG